MILDDIEAGGVGQVEDQGSPLINPLVPGIIIVNHKRWNTN